VVGSAGRPAVTGARFHKVQRISLAAEAIDAISLLDQISADHQLPR
jgi:uncharacterized protein (UPF0147 family)